MIRVHTDRRFLCIDSDDGAQNFIGHSSARKFIQYGAQLRKTEKKSVFRWGVAFYQKIIELAQALMIALILSLARRCRFFFCGTVGVAG